MRYADLVEVFVTSTIIALLVTPLMRVVAFRTGYLDHPRDNKRHAHAMPLLGGVAIFCAFFIGILSQWDVVAATQRDQALAILSGISILLVLGLIDDKIGMMPNVKLLGQFLAAMVVYKSGLQADLFENYYLNLIITYLWVVGITNAFNLLDNMNGLATGIAVIAAFSFGLIACVNQQTVVAVVSFCICGSCLGFLRYNFPKASIFMGDTGSLVMGFILASIALLGDWRSGGYATSVAIPLLVLAYPIFDTTLVTVMRAVERRSVFEGGKDHSSHRLALAGLRSKNAVLLIYAICAMLGIAGVVVSKAPYRIGVSVVAVACVALVLFGIRLSRVDSGRFGRKKAVSDDGKK